MVGRQFGWLWTAYTISTFGTWLGFGAFPLIAILVLRAGPVEVSLLSAAGLAVGAVVAMPLGPWVEVRRKRPVMITMDLIRFAALLSVPAAYGLGRLTFTQLVVVSVVSAAADITFKAAGGSYLKDLVPRSGLLAANSRFEATTWTATVLGPPLGNALLGLLGPVTTVLIDATSYLLSALSLRAIGGDEPRRERFDGPRLHTGDLRAGWRHILNHPVLRRLFFNTVLVNGLILANAPLLAVLLLDRLGFTPWQYGLAFGVPCLGGLLGSRLARPLVARFGHHRVLVTAGALRACWPIGLVLVVPGATGLVVVLVVQFGLVTAVGVFNPVFATYRLDQTAPDRVARTLSAWSITSNATVAALTALWGLLAAATSLRFAIAAAGLLILTTPLLLPRSTRTHLAHENA
ncbi:MFS transporter [Paractinoplanes abujensis]|uniref:MFS family permease n=1 Tax=Paractinoplanes abujensis TaxID=882441 RepID=A0A7W7CQC9_9ACTN|nr:MFS transporter [Actinoplanes abujensis]MBB4692790.1 MFS family permease [Actinoplanes abujensis]GID22711.1 MFS transporter [Actinoplanes abujensis]